MDLLEDLRMYARFVRDVLFPLHEWAEGHPTVTVLNEMEIADNTKSELEQLRRAKLRDFIDYCSAHVPYVRMRLQEAGIAASEIRDVADLTRSPLMRNADVRMYRENLRSHIAGELSPIATGGSTGEPLICDLSKRRHASRVACRQRVSRRWGASVGEREVAMGDSPVELSQQDRLRAVRDRLLRTKLLRSSIQITFEYLSSLRVERSGKFRHVVSEVPIGKILGNVLPEPTRLAPCAGPIERQAQPPGRMENISCESP